jgi:hypothetical protein
MQMARNLVSLSFAEQRLTTIRAALSTLETELAELVSIPAAQRRELFKMGDKSEVFCRETLSVLADNPKLVPESLGLPEAQGDLAALDALRPLLHRLQQLVERGESTEIALGSDIFGAALEGYGLLKVSGKHHGLEGKRRDLSARFVRSARVVTPEPVSA